MKSWTQTVAWPRRFARRGQSSVEYLVITAIVLALIAVPIEGQDSVVALMLDSIHTAYQKFLAALSLPQ